MLRIVHPIAGALALIVIATFWIATALSELFGTPGTIIAVKITIPWGFLVLIPLLASAGATGAKLAGDRRRGLAESKSKRMPIIAANGILVLVPAALFLAQKAKAGALDGTFFAVQGLELLAGALNLVLLGLNLRDGLRLTGRVH